MARALAVTAAVLVVAAGCGTSGGGSGRPRVVASFFPLAEAAERAGGDAVEVTDLTPRGTEPHDVELAPDQVDDLLDADLVVYLGGGFQPAVEDVVDDRDGPSVDALEVAGVDEGDDVDPHVWLDPTLMSRIVRAVGDAVADVVPEHRGDVAATCADPSLASASLGFRARVGLEEGLRRVVAAVPVVA